MAGHIRGVPWSAWMVALAIAVGGSLLAPVPAEAAFLGIDPAQWAVDGFKAILGWVFGDVEDLGRNLVRVLLYVPLLMDRSDFPKLNRYREYVTIAAWVLLVLSLVVSTTQAWASNWGSGGAFEAFEGLKRTVGAALLLLGFGFGFEQAVKVVNALTSGLIVNPIIGNAMEGTLKVFAASIVTGIVGGGGVGMIMLVLALFMAILLLVVKTVVTALLAVLWIGSPLAIALWPIEELSTLLKSLLSTIIGILSFPVLWALCFAAFALLPADALFASDTGDFINAILSPLITLAMLIIALVLPFAVMRQLMQAGLMPRPMRVARMAMSRGGGGGGGGGVARGRPVKPTGGWGQTPRGPQPRDGLGRWTTYD